MEGALPACGLAVPRELIAVAVCMYLRFGAPSRRWGVARWAGHRDQSGERLPADAHVHARGLQGGRATLHQMESETRPPGAYRSASAWAFGLRWLNRTTYRW